MSNNEELIEIINAAKSLNKTEQEIAGIINNYQREVVHEQSHDDMDVDAPEELGEIPVIDDSPQPIFEINGEDYDLESVTELAGDTSVEEYVNKNNGVVKYDKSHVSDEVKVTPIYESTSKRADELIQEEMDLIFDKVYEGESRFKINTKTPPNYSGDPSKDVELSDRDKYLVQHNNNPLTGLEEIKDGYTVTGVRRSRLNVKGNSSLTSIELKSIANNTWSKLMSENEYISSTKPGSFNDRIAKKTEQELTNWAIEFQANMNWEDPFVWETFGKAYQNKVEEIWTREAKLDAEYQHNFNLIESIVHDKFKPLIVNKTIEEQKGALTPDWVENAGPVMEGFHNLLKYQLPSLRTESNIFSDGMQMSRLANNIKDIEKRNYKDEQQGYLGVDNNGIISFYVHKKGQMFSPPRKSKKVSWGYAKEVMNNKMNDYGNLIMKNMVISNEYQEKLALLDMPGEIWDENWNWNLDAEGYKSLFGTQLGQMGLAVLTFGGSTFLQELGGMSQQLIYDKSVMAYHNIPLDKDLKNFSEKEITALYASFEKNKGKIVNDPRHGEITLEGKIALDILENGHIPFETLYTRAAGIAGLDFVGNWFVVGKASKAFPKQLLNGIVTKNYKMFYKGLKGVAGLVGATTLAEMLTEGAQAGVSSATVASNSPLKHFDWRGMVNEASAAALIPGPVTIGGMTITSIVQDVKLQSMGKQYKNWFNVAKKKIQNSDMTLDEKTKLMEHLWNAEQIVADTKLKDVTHQAQKDNIADYLIKNQSIDTNISEIKAEIEKMKKEVGSSAKTTDLDKKIEKLEQQKQRNNEKIIQERTVDNFLTNVVRQANWQNSQTTGKEKNNFTVIFETKKEAEEYFKKNYSGKNIKQFNNIIKGRQVKVYNERTKKYETKTIFDYAANSRDGKTKTHFIIKENVIEGIYSGDLTAGNVFNHEQGHNNMANMDEEYLKKKRKEVMIEMENSEDPQIKQVLIIMEEKLKQYRDKSGRVTNHEEFFTAMSDAFHYLNMSDISVKGSTTLSFIGDIFSSIFEENIGPIVDWKTGFDDVGVVEFIKSYTEQESVESTNPISEMRGGEEPGIFDEDVEKGKDGIYVQDSRRVYPTGRTSEEIKQANAIIQAEIRDEKANPSYTNPDNPALEAKIREDQLKKLNGELIANNMGLINKFLKHQSNGGLYFDPKAGDVNYTDFSEAVMAEVGIIINSYDETKGDFGMYLGTLMNKRMPGIWDNLIRQKEVAPDPDAKPVPDEGGYDSVMNSFEDEIIIFGGQETTRSAATSEMRKRLGIKTGDQVYNEILDEVINITIQNYDAINEEGFYQDTKERFQKALFQKIKTQMGGSPGSPKFQAWLRDNVEDLYNLLPQSVFNKSYDQFNIIEGRANVEQSRDKDVEFAKGVKIKSDTAGNRVATKMPFTEEIGEQFINAILNPDKGRPASKQNSLIEQIIEVIAFDAVGTAMQSDAFKNAHGDQDAIMGVVADKINRDMTVQFSTRMGKVELKTIEQYKNVGDLIRSVEMSGLVDAEETSDYIDKIAIQKGYDKDVINFVKHLDSNEIIEKGDAIKFKVQLMDYLKTEDPDLYNELKETGAIKGKKVALDKIAEEVEIFAGGLDAEMLDAAGFDILAFHRRVLNSAKTQHGPKRGDGTVVKKYNAKNPDGNRSYANKNTTLLLEGWTFDPKTNQFFHNENKYKPSLDPVTDHGASTVSAPYYQTLENIKAANELKLAEIAEKNKDNPDYVSKYNDVRIMNADVPGGLFKKIGKILNGPGTRQEKIDKIIKNHGLEIQAANKANYELAKDMGVSMVESVLNGDMSASTLVHVLQGQSNLAFGFRGLTRLTMISIADGTYKQDGSRLYGEHVNPNSGKMLELAKIVVKAKNDPEYNYKEAIATLFADHDQIILPSDQATGTKGLDKNLDPTSTASYDRLKTLTKEQQKNFVGINGESYQEALAKANVTKNILIETAKQEFESERKIKKQKATNNILVGDEKGSTVYDFDETLAYSDNVVRATNKITGEVVELTSDQWKDWRGGEDYSYDFTDFNYVTNGKPGPMIPDLIKTIDKHGVDGVFILTARHQDSAIAMHDFINGELVKHYKKKGVAMKDIPQIPLENFTGVGNSTGEAKANWIQESLIINGEYNRIKFADDAMFNIDAVQDMFNTWPPELLEGKTILVQESRSTDFNKMLERTEGMKAEATFSDAQGRIRGRKGGNWLRDILYPASAYDFEQFTYMYRGKGEQGEADAVFFKETLFDPYEKAIQQIDKEKQEVRNNYKALIKELPQVKKDLKKNIKGTNYTVEQAIRVYTWSKNGMEIPGLSKRDQKQLIEYVEQDQELVMFSDRLSAISQQDGGYVAPTDYWTVETIAYDLTEMTGSAGRAKYLTLWKENVNEIFSEENKNKLRALYGNDHVEALEDMLYRMEYGRNKNKPGRIEQQWNNWVNNSVGAVMFFNMRSATLQTISAFNYIDWENNNIANAALAFANQPQYWKDFSFIFNSDYLKERRAGSKRTVNEAELAAHLKGKDNKAKAALAWLLEKGFTPTQIADSFAIASGGAGFYRNQIKFYEKQGMSTKDAEAQAFLDFRDKTEKGQQSSRADMISQQQAGGLGRLILAFKNTPMQYNRQIIKAIADLKNGRGSAKTNLSKIAYYGAVQNAIFTSLQTALFSALGDEDEWDNKKERVANGMIDSILNGMGLTGTVAATIKNGYISYSKQKKRGWGGDQTRTIVAFANLSPTIGSKIRKLYGGIRTEQINQEAIDEMGLNINNPGFNALANVVSATTNIPLDRAVSKIQNILLAADDETSAKEAIGLLLGWNPWDLGMETTSERVKKEVKEKKRKEKEAREKPCKGISKGTGKKCGNKTENSNGYCYAHQSQAPKKK